MTEIKKKILLLFYKLCSKLRAHASSCLNHRSIALLINFIRRRFRQQHKNTNKTCTGTETLTHTRKKSENIGLQGGQ